MTANIDFSFYRCRILNRALLRARCYLGLEEPYPAFCDNQPPARSFMDALGKTAESGVVTLEECDDLTNSGLIVSGLNGRHAVFEISMTATEGDIVRALRRAEILATITGETVQPVIVTSLLSEWEERRAVNSRVITFVMPFPQPG